MGTPGLLSNLIPADIDEIPRQIRDLERFVRELGPSIALSIKPAMDDIRANVAAIAAQQVTLTAQQVALADQDVRIIAQQDALAAQNTTILAQQAELAAQNVRLTAAVANIATLVGQQVAGDTKSANTGGGATNLATSFGDYAGATFTVPPGFTRAVVSAVANTYYVTATGVELQVNIAGNVGYLQMLLNGQNAGSASHAATLTGLSGGGTFTVWSRARVQGAGASGAYLNTTATAIFLR